MSRKPYDELPWWCQFLYPWFGPPWYAEIEDLDAWLPEVKRQLAGRVDELTEELAGEVQPGEGYPAKAGRLTAARYQAEQSISREFSPLPSGDRDDGDEDEPTPYGDRPMVVDRDDLSWSEVDAEQRERTGDPSSEDGRP